MRSLREVRALASFFWIVSFSVVSSWIDFSLVWSWVLRVLEASVLDFIVSGGGGVDHFWKLGESFFQKIDESSIFEN